MKKIAFALAVLILTQTAYAFKQATFTAEISGPRIGPSKPVMAKTGKSTKVAPKVVNKTPKIKPTKPPAPVYVPQSGCEQYRGLVSKYNWDIATAMAVMEAESTQDGIACNSRAANYADNHGSCMGSFGLFQLACFRTATPFDPAHNIAKAYKAYAAAGGWTPWGAYTNGSYLKYLR